MRKLDWVECDCKRQAEQFAHLTEEYRERFFTYELLHSPKSLAAHLESYLLHIHYTSQLDDLDIIEVDPLEVDWITLHRDYAYNKMWGDSRTSILKAIKCKL